MEPPFTVGWALLHLGLLPLLLLVFGKAALQNGQALLGLILLGATACMAWHNIALLGFEWWAAGSIVYMILVAIPIGLVGRLLGFG